MGIKDLVSHELDQLSEKLREPADRRSPSTPEREWMTGMRNLRGRLRLDLRQY